MSMRNEQGFTLAEVMIAIVLLGVGVMALVSGAAMTSRMIGRGRESTLVGQVATARIEWLRQLAASTSPACGAAALQTGSASAPAGITERWVVPNAGNPRTVQLMFTYRVPQGIRTDTISTTLLCN